MVSLNQELRLWSGDTKSPTCLEPCGALEAPTKWTVVPANVTTMYHMQETYVKVHVYCALRKHKKPVCTFMHMLLLMFPV